MLRKWQKTLVAKIPADIRHSIDVVVSPAMGGVIIGHEMGRALDLDALFLERPEGTFELRRGFRLEEGQKGADDGGRGNDRAFIT